GGGFPQRSSDDSHYRALGLTRDATRVDIKNAYRQIALKHHPDKSQNAESADIFKAANAAYEVLSDSERKQHYDSFGLQQPPQHPNPHGTFAQFFNMQPRQRPTIHELTMTFEEIFTGKHYKMRVNVDIECPTCLKSCSTCQGSGVQVCMRELAPGFIQRIETMCLDCNGQRKAASKGCKSCNGKGTTLSSQNIEFDVPPGASSGDSFAFKGANGNGGDIVFVTKVKPHNLFKRQGVNLHMSKTLTLEESLCGFTFDVTKLDGITVHVNREREVTKPQATHIIKKAGFRCGADCGDIIITFMVEFPDS
ncbi:hypothetical protein JKP88DRAFT_149699, partial [Tribonema minus]